MARAAFWGGGVSDGTTLWFVDNTADEARCLRSCNQSARDSAKDIDLATGELDMARTSDGTTLWFVDRHGTDEDIIAYLASDQSRQAADDITHADLAGNLFGGVYANGIAWFVEPDDGCTAIAFVQPSTFPRSTSGPARSRKPTFGSTEVDRIYVGSTRVF